MRNNRRNNMRNNMHTLAYIARKIDWPMLAITLVAGAVGVAIIVGTFGSGAESVTGSQASYGAATDNSDGDGDGAEPGFVPVRTDAEHEAVARVAAELEAPMCIEEDEDGCFWSQNSGNGVGESFVSCIVVGDDASSVLSRVDVLTRDDIVVRRVYSNPIRRGLLDVIPSSTAALRDGFATCTLD